MTIRQYTLTSCFSLHKQSTKNCFTYSCAQLTVSSHTGSYKQSGPVNSMSSAGWQSGVLPYKLGGANTGPLGPSNSGWVPIGVNNTPTSIQSPSYNKMLSRGHGPDHHRSRAATVQRSNHGDTSYSREFYLPTVPCGEKRWGAEASNKLEVPQSICENRAFQDGGASSTPRPSTVSGLDGEDGPERCLSPNPNSLRPSTPPFFPIIHVTL